MLVALACRMRIPYYQNIIIIAVRDSTRDLACLFLFGARVSNGKIGFSILYASALCVVFILECLANECGLGRSAGSFRFIELFIIIYGPVTR